MVEVYRQGDVLLVPVNTAPKKVKKVERDNDRVILAYGEVTGHAHAILDKSVSLNETPTKKRFLDAPDGATLTHEEHGTVILPSGVYEVKRQQEYSPEEIRDVAD